MISFYNADSKESHSSDIDLFICTVGYEERSYYFLDQFNYSLNYNKVLVFTTDNYEKFETAKNKIEELKLHHYNVVVVKYEDFTYVLGQIKDAVQKKIEEKEQVRISIDYSSMPRSWYCRLPALLEKFYDRRTLLIFGIVRGTIRLREISILQQEIIHLNWFREKHHYFRKRELIFSD